MSLKDWDISSMVKGTCNSAKISCRTLGNGNLNVAGKMCRESSYKVDLHLHDLQTIYSRSVQFAYQSKSLEYTVLAKASRLKAAESGSSGFVMLPSGVTMTRLQNDSAIFHL
ncbi:hypothetical protein Dsin_000016 [Dipteronia sinensis]|uniref:Uncharacterized protein n=1 Tax=Dipteronia sinensis TaxID=43782 RepID=A0AAD9Z025_9ROSI|nr:hypothetical protein Dsin_000016 [Dipteronia sinensis]